MRGAGRTQDAHGARSARGTRGVGRFSLQPPCWCSVKTGFTFADVIFMFLSIQINPVADCEETVYITILTILAVAVFVAVDALDTFQITVKSSAMAPKSQRARARKGWMLRMLRSCELAC